MTGERAWRRGAWALLLTGGLAAGASAPAVPRTPEAKKLAADLLARIERLYYSLHETDVQGFEATFTIIESPGDPTQRLTVQWDRGRGGLRTAMSASSDPDDEESSWVVGGMMRAVLEEALLGCSRAERIAPGSPARGAVKAYAVQDGEGWRVDLTEHLRAACLPVQEYSLRVAENLGAIHARYVYPDGSERTFAIRGQEARGRRYVAAITHWMRLAGEPGMLAERYSIGYTHRQGVAFPRFVAVQVTVDGEEAGTVRATLQDVTFRMGAALAEENLTKVAVPCSQEAEELAQELIHRLNQSTYSLLRTEVQGFEATYTVTLDRERRGRYVGTWRRGAGDVTGRFHGDVDPEEKKMLVHDGSSALRLLMVQPPCEPKTYAVRRGEEYVFECQAPPAGLKTKRLCLSADLCRYRHRVVYDDGHAHEATLVHQRAGETRYLRFFHDWLPKDRFGTYIEYTYTRRTAVVFPSRIRVWTLDPGGAGGDFLRHVAVYRLDNAVFRQGKHGAKSIRRRPGPSGPPPGVDARRTSADPAYGTTKEKPIPVGVSRESLEPGVALDREKVAVLMALPARRYVTALRDARGRRVQGRFEARVPLPEGFLWPCTLTDADGKTTTIYFRSQVCATRAEAERVNAQAKAPKGMYFAGQ